MKPIDSSIFSTPQAILIMGPPGGGKSTFALQWPALWVADCDRNLAGPMRYLQSKGIPVTAQRSEIQFDDEMKSVKLEDQYDRLTSETDKAIKDPNIKNIFIDSLTHLDQIVYAYSCKKQGVKTLEWNHYPFFKRTLYSYIMSIRDSSKNLLVACHENIEHDKKGAVEKYTVTMSTNLKNYIGYMFTDIWRCKIEPIGGGRVAPMIYTHPTAVSDLKNSLLLGEKIDATYAAVEAAIRKTQTK